jgi:hypothetical protein
MTREPEPWTAGPKAPHIVVDTDGHAFVCLHCTTRDPFPVPVQLMDWTRAGFNFVEDHKGCKPAPRPVVEVDQGSLL